MKKLLLLTLITTALTPALQARQLTPDEALGRLAGSAAAPSRSGNTQLVYTDTNDSGTKGVYVFSRGEDNGFLVVSADDCAQALLGYSYSGTFDPDNMPANMQSWLNGYTDQIAFMSGLPAPTETDDSETRPYREPLGPLCLTKWNQDAPFNNLCPLSSGQRTPVGCAATAMAQVLKYHNWPKQGSGSKTYTSKNLNIELSFDFGATTFDWDNMLNEYNSSATEIQKDAVATLSYACGVASDMNYAMSGSAAGVSTALKGMIKYLNYDCGASIQQRKWYDLYGWEDMIYKTLSENGPVMYYGASSSQSAHEFVCDGYDKDGYFHINWGWGGLSDGFFLLSALDPYSQGIGGSTGGFNLWQNAVVDICPAKADSHYAQIVTTNQNINGAGNGSELTIEGRFNNESIADLNNVMFGVKIDDKFFSGQKVTLLQEGYGVSKYIVNLAGLPEGTYRAYPAYKTDVEDWQVMRGDVSNVNYLDITVTPNGNIIVNNNSSAAVKLELNNFKAQTPFTPGDSFRLTATLINKGGQEFYDDIVVILSGSIAPVEIARTKVDVLPGSSQDITIESILPENIKVGTYSLMIARIVDGKTSAIGTPIRVTVSEVSGLEDVTAESEVTAIEIYTITGTRVPAPAEIDSVESLATADIPSGIYILSLTYSDGHRSTVKYIKK